MSPVFVEGAGAGQGSIRGDVGPNVPPPPSNDPTTLGNKSLAAARPAFAPHLLLRHLARESARALRVSRVGIWRFENEGSRVRLVTRYNRSEGSIQEDEVYPEHLAPAFRSFLERASVLAVGDTRRVAVAAEPVREWLERETIRSILALPVRLDERLVGLVTFEEGRSPRDWTPEDRDLASSLVLPVGEPLARIEYRDNVHLPSVAPDEPQETPGLVPSHGPGARNEPIPQTRVRRLGHLESVALVGAEEATGLLGALEVQAGYLRMLRDATEDRSADQELVSGALDTGKRIEEGLGRFLGTLRHGIPDRPSLDLNRALAAMIPVLAREVGERGRLRVAPTVGPLPVEANVGFLERALVHLVENAREASGPDESIRVAWGPAPEGSGGDSGWEGARIRVQDQGEGIPREHLPWLFEPFFSSRSEGHPLRGLGLSTVQAIVEGHGGWVEVRSRQAEGTEVDLFLPLAAAPVDRTMVEARGSATAAGSAPAPRAKVVVLEDEPLLARLLRQILSRAGYEVEVCMTAVESEREWRRAGRRIDLMIVERVLSGGRSGIEVGREWQRRKPGLPLIVLDRQASTHGGTTESATNGELTWITPPFEPGEIAGRVAEMLEASPGVAEDEIVSAGGSNLTH